MEVTATAVSATGKGFVRVYPEGEPTATFLNYTNVFDAGNTGTVGLCGLSGGACLVDNDITVRNFTSSTHIVVDVQGYYLQPMAASINIDGSINRSSRALSAVKTDTGTYNVIFDRNITACTYTGVVGHPVSSAPDGTINITPLGVNGNGLYVQTRQADGVASDRPFYVEVTC